MRFNPVSCVLARTAGWFVALAALALAGGARAALQAADPAPDPAVRYRDCMTMIETDAERAFDQALEWRDLGGGHAAAHCAAAALLALGYYAEAAGRLEELAQKPTDDLAIRIELLRQAAQGWSLAKKPERALGALSAAINLDGGRPKFFLERAVAQADMGLYDKAVDDLTKCLSLDPLSTDAYAFRASAYRYLDQLDLALADADRVLAQEPSHLEARLERGIIRRLRGDDAGARRDWLLILDLAADLPIADTARRNIELLDVRDN